MGVVNYLNTLPLLYGLERSPVMQEAVFMPDFPSNVARKLKNGEIDAGFIPSAVLPEIPSGRIFSSYCISSDGPVASVCLMSEVPLAEIETVLLDYQSRTSVELLKLLYREHWKRDVRFVEAQQEFQPEIGGTTAGLLIGDRCLDFRDQRLSLCAANVGDDARPVAEPSAVRCAQILSQRLAPADHVIALPLPCVLRLQHDPRVHGEHALPAAGAAGQDHHAGLRESGCSRQAARARPVRCAIVARIALVGVERCARRDGQQE